MVLAEPYSSVISIQDLNTAGLWFKPPTWPIFFPGNDDSHCDKIHSSLTAVHCFDYGSVGKQPLSLEEYYAGYWFNELQESMDRCTGPAIFPKYCRKRR